MKFVLKASRSTPKLGLSEYIGVFISRSLLPAMEPEPSWSEIPNELMATPRPLPLPPPLRKSLVCGGSQQ